MRSIQPGFDINPRTKGSYMRATQDIGRALVIVRRDGPSSISAFLFLYFACEKLAKIMKGVCHEERFSNIFPRGKVPKYTDIQSYASVLGCRVAKRDIESIFASESSKSAKSLRNKLVHELGPSHAAAIEAASKRLLPIMERFVNCADDVVRYLVDSSE